ncbi:MAG: DUF2799 domain-containing protein [Gammaproteobacteria bacterium]
MDSRKQPDFLIVWSPLRAAVMVLLLLIQGCASLNKEECMAADWRLIGYQDGVAGKSSSAVGTYRKDCAEYAVVPDLDAYQAGRTEGLLEYCKADKGYHLGKSGRGFPMVCPPHLEADFRAAYNQGREIYLARSAVNQTHARIHECQDSLQQLEEDKSYKLAELVSDGLMSEQRILILYEISEIELERDDLEDEIVALEYELAERQEYLDRLSRDPFY